MSVRRYLHTKRVRLVNNCLNFFKCILPHAGACSFARRSARCTYLDDIYAVFPVFSHLLPNRPRPVGNATGGNAIVSGKEVVVAVATGTTECWSSNLEPWPRDAPIVDCVSQ